MKKCSNKKWLYNGCKSGGFTPTSKNIGGVGGKDVFNAPEKTLDYGRKQPIGTT